MSAEEPDRQQKIRSEIWVSLSQTRLADTEERKEGGEERREGRREEGRAESMEGGVLESGQEGEGEWEKRQNEGRQQGK